MITSLVNRIIVNCTYENYLSDSNRDMNLKGEIGEREQSEKALRESEEKLHSLVTNIPDVLWTTDCHGKTTFISRNVEKVYGFTPEEVYEATSDVWFGRIHPDDVECVRAAYELLLTSNQMFDVEYCIQRKDGKDSFL